MIAYLPLLISIIGLLLYGFAGNSKLQEVGRIMFFCGILVVTMHLGGKMTKVF